eukprot:Ihof_evm13s149 gene=Ihof_evmTU13s149
MRDFTPSRPLNDKEDVRDGPATMTPPHISQKSSNTGEFSAHLPSTYTMQKGNDTYISHQPSYEYGPIGPSMNLEGPRIVPPNAGAPPSSHFSSVEISQGPPQQYTGHDQLHSPHYGGDTVAMAMQTHTSPQQSKTSSHNQAVSKSVIPGRKRNWSQISEDTISGAENEVGPPRPDDKTRFESDGNSVPSLKTTPPSLGVSIPRLQDHTDSDIVDDHLTSHDPIEMGSSGPQHHLNASLGVNRHKTMRLEEREAISGVHDGGLQMSDKSMAEFIKFQRIARENRLIQDEPDAATSFRTVLEILQLSFNQEVHSIMDIYQRLIEQAACNIHSHT